MSNIFAFKFWFNMYAGNLYPPVQKAFIVFLIAMVVLVFLANLFKKRGGYLRVVWEKIHTFGTINLIIGAVLLFFTVERLPFLSMRLWFLIWMIAMIIWAVYVIKEYRKIPSKIEEIKKEAEYKKYLP